MQADELAAALTGQVRGAVLGRGHPDYDAARSLWNGRFDHRPALIARCLDASDVASAVHFARAHGLTLSVRAGGHDFAGHGICDGGLAIDLSPLSAVELDAGAGIARIGGGAVWADVDRAMHAAGVVTPGATVSSVGVAGFTLGGGQGHLSRLHGLACDNVRAVEVVSAAGNCVRASAQENAELFWALRGGGGNFGIVTRFEMRAHPLATDIVAGQILYRYQDARAVLRHYRDVMSTAPDAMQCWAFLLRMPPLPGVAEELHGTPVLDLLAVHATPGRDQYALDALRSFGEPLLDSVAPQPYLELQQAFDAAMAAKGRRWYSRGQYLRALPDSSIDTLVAQCERLPGEFTSVYLGAEGGALARTHADATAFPHRDAAFSLHVFPGWSDPAEDEPIMQWARTVHASMAPHGTGGVYVNMLAEDEQARVAAAYGGNLARLARIKREWDPDNLLRGNRNIVPSQPD